MHPIFKQRHRLGLYLGSWIPFAALLTTLLVVIAASSWAEAVLLAAPLTLVYAFLCLAAWYPCRARPLQSSPGLQVIALHGTTGLVSAAAWVGMAMVYAELLGRHPVFVDATARIRAHAVVLLSLGFLVYVLSVAVHYLFAAFEASQRAERRALEADVAAKVSELEMLRSQVNPHFLFNSLNSVSSLTTRDPEAAREMCVELGDFLRGTLQLRSKTTIPLDEELAVVDRYLTIEKFRFAERLRVRRSVDAACLEHSVPPMLLQPLVENALKHGIAGLVEGGDLEIEAVCSGDSLRLTIANPFDPAAPSTRGEGLGLPHLRRRLDTLYGPAASLRTKSEKDRFTVAVILPPRPVEGLR